MGDACMQNPTRGETHACSPTHIHHMRQTPVCQSAKQKAVLDLLRELRQQGLGANGATPALRALRDPVALAHAPAPFALEGLLLLPSPSTGASSNSGGVFGGGRSVCLSVCLSVCPSVCLSVYPSVCLSVSQSVSLFVRTPPPC